MKWTDQAVTGALRLVVCRAVAKALSNNDALLTANFGNGMTTRLWPGDSPEAMAAAQSIRAYRYQTRQADEEDSFADFSGEVELCSSVTEQECLRKGLTRAGRRLDPPADWIDPSP